MNTHIHLYIRRNMHTYTCVRVQVCMSVCIEGKERQTHPFYLPYLVPPTLCLFLILSLSLIPPSLCVPLYVHLLLSSSPLALSIPFSLSLSFIFNPCSLPLKPLFRHCSATPSLHLSPYHHTHLRLYHVPVSTRQEKESGFRFSCDARVEIDN